MAATEGHLPDGISWRPLRVTEEPEEGHRSVECKALKAVTTREKNVVHEDEFSKEGGGATL